MQGMGPRFEAVRERLRLHHRMVGHSLSARLPGLLYRLRKGMAVSEQEREKEESGWPRCYVDDCDGEVTERLRLHMRGQEPREVLACEKHAAILRMMAL